MNKFQMLLLQLRPSQYFIECVLGRVFGNKEHRRFLKLVPKECVYCELLGICRDEDNNWECINGCLTGEDIE